MTNNITTLNQTYWMATFYSCCPTKVEFLSINNNASMPHSINLSAWKKKQKHAY